MANEVREFETSSGTGNAASSAAGFHISKRPIVGTDRGERGPGKETPGDLPASYGTDLLYVIARDPRTLFLYWDLNWTRLFAQAGLSPRQVQVRIYREDGSSDGVHEINPFRGHAYVDVAAGGSVYFCELGCFDDGEWSSLMRSGTTTTPEAAMSDDLSAKFATLPIHLSFQRLLDIFRATTTDGKTLAHSVAMLQGNTPALRKGTAPGPNGHGDGAQAAEITALLEAARQAGARSTPTPEQRAKWKELSERLGSSSWRGASESSLGGSSPA